MRYKYETPTTNARWEKLCCSGQSWYQIAEEMKLDCRQLERELTAAREEITILKSKYADHHAEAERLTSEIRSVTEQRDEAYAMLRRIARKGEFMDMEGQRLVVFDWLARRHISSENDRCDTSRTDDENKLNAVTEQINNLKQAVDCASDLLASVTEQRDTALRDLEFRRALYKLQKQQLYDVREQRDKLIEALEEMRYAHTDKAERMAIEALEGVKKEVNHEY